MLNLWRTIRRTRWKPWVLVGIAALAWWCYSAPIHLVGRIRNAVENADASDAAALVAARVDFAQVNEQLSGDLRSAVEGQLDAAAFSHLLRYGWLERQKAKTSIDRSQQTRLYRVRYRGLNHFMALYWDPPHVHEVILTLRRKSVFQRWHVTEVRQFNVCAYDFDCALVADSNGPPQPVSSAPPAGLLESPVREGGGKESLDGGHAGE